MWSIRPGEPPLPTGPHARRRPSIHHTHTHSHTHNQPPSASQAHVRRQSTSSSTTASASAAHRLDTNTLYLTPRILPRRIISLNDPARPQAPPTTNFKSAAEKSLPPPQQRHGGTNLPPVPELAWGGGAGGKRVPNSYSLPANLTASYHNGTSNKSHDAAPPRPSPRPRYCGGPPARVSAPQNLDGDSSDGTLDDRETQTARIVRRSFSSTSYRFLTAERPADYDPVGAKKVYNYMPSGYWAGRTSSILDRLAAEYPDEALAERAKMAFEYLQIMACGPGAEQSLMEFKRVFDRKMKDGKI